MKKQVEIDVTPKEMAEKFWSMNDSEQAEFFEHLYNETKKCKNNSQLQWLCMTDRIKENPKAKDCFLEFTAFAYDFWPQKVNL